MQRFLCLSLMILAFAGIAWAQNSAGTSDETLRDKAASDFDPHKHWDIHDLHEGMRGYGMTVFSGTRPERFEVELVSVVHHFSPKRSVFFVRVLDNPIFDKANGVSGVSGSPVYFEGKLAGAMSFGWAYSQEPLYGVTPIRDMLEVRRAASVSPKAQRTSALPRDLYKDLMRETLLSSECIAAMTARTGLSEGLGGDAHGLRHLPLSFSCSAMNAASTRLINRIFGPIAINSMAGFGGASDVSMSPEEALQTLEPGGTVTVPLIYGDMNGTVLGTITEVVGNRVYAFGHGWMSEGAVHWPMAAGRVHTFVSRADMSFKLGQATTILGTLAADEGTAVFGEIGEAPAMAPMKIRVRWPDIDYENTFRIQIARDETASAILATLVLSNTLSDRGGLPREHTIDYTIKAAFDGFEAIEYRNSVSGDSGYGMLFGFYQHMGMILQNPWVQTALNEVEADMVIHHADRQALLESATLSVRKAKPGETVVCRMKLMPNQKEAVYVELPFTVPANQEPGEYQLVLMDGQGYQEMLGEANPGKYSAEKLEDVHRIFTERLNISKKMIYAAIETTGRGVRAEATDFPKLPSSRSIILQGSTPQRMTTPISAFVCQEYPSDYVMTGRLTVPMLVEK